MESVTKHGVILERTDLNFENLGVLNPAIYQEGNTIHMFYRAAQIGNFSSIGYCKLEGPLKVIERASEPIISPEYIYEIHGVEDPRITKIEDLYYLSYAAYDGINVFGAYAVSKDLKKFKKKGIITPKFLIKEYSDLLRHGLKNSCIFDSLLFNLNLNYPLDQSIESKIYVWDKNVVFFPKKINGKFAVFHRLFPSIQLLYFNKPSELTVEFWREYISNLSQHIVMSPKYEHETSHIGSGSPPIETKEGWLIIYHSVEKREKGLVYHASAALLDLNNPLKVIARLKKPLISPTEYYERHGYVNYVVFPTGTAIFNDRLYIYYGAADDKIAVASININDLLLELKNNKNENERP
ncbi:pesticidal protein Cry7Aa [Flavobacterium sp. ALJ2]|uniref:glycoside hydrolase family 130 protein n=1 Tax=Flavobacterium sp. ALJ2 TaxID=2786960 RepID=UPI00189C766A|nr:pesticidal protein Cry7Aa [Flavobacterium sp. ALJ2]MBF7091508.1 pesticidal protein Cry7Aa [Flavobacterium sp. ALJ2]